MGNLGTPGSLGRASEWQLYVKIIRRFNSPRILLRTSSGQSAGWWVSSQKEVRPQAGRLVLGKRGSHNDLPRRTNQGLVGCWVPTLVAWEGSRLRLVGLDVLPTYKRVVAWLPGPAEDTERYLQRLR